MSSIFMEEKYGRVSGCVLVTQSEWNEPNQNALRALASITLHAAVKERTT